MEVLRNPFRFGGEIAAPDLVDREAETSQIESTIRDGEKLFLIGPRRFGKSSILRAAAERLTASGAIVLRIDADPVSDIGMLVEEIVSLSAARLKGKVHQVIDQIRKVFFSLRPEVKFDITEHHWSATMGIRPPAGPDQAIAQLVDALHGLERLALALPKSKPVGLIIDEFQHVIELGGERAEAQIRSAIQQHSRVGYVFAGSDTRMMTAMTSNADRPFYRLGTIKMLGPVPRPDFAAFITRNMRRSGFRVESGAVDAILNLAEDVPFNIQSLAHSCWEELRSEKRGEAPALTVELVQKALLRSVMELDPIYTEAWVKLTPIQQNTLRAVIRQQGVGMSSSAVVRTIGASPSTVQRALESLHNQKILRDEPSEGKIQTRFDDPFFAHWIRFRAMKPDDRWLGV
jgi:energy-coupling factor transporter ATP-binding protein EcfA2